MNDDVAVVTGAASGIGQAVARQLAGQGMRVALADLDVSGAQATLASLPGQGHMAVGLDVGQADAIAPTFARLEELMGPARVLVTCAGVLLTRADGGRPSLWDIDPEEWDATFRVNSRGTFLCCKAFVGLRRSRPLAHARVVTFSSVTAQLGGYRASAAYIASKAAVIGLTKAIAREVAPMGMTANVVAPGLIETPMLEKTLPPHEAGMAAASIPLGRLGVASDVAGAVAFLASRESGYITGSVMDVNGGYRMQ